MNAQGKTRLKIWATLIVVFALGCVTGASIAGIYQLWPKAETQSQTASSDQGYPSMRDTDAYFETLKRELSLNDEQSSKMRAILDRIREEYKAVCADVRPRYDTLRGRARSEMRALLSAEQQQRFDSIITQEDCRCPEPKKP